MKTKPWEDIHHTSEWDELLENYRKGQMMSKAKTTGQKIGYFFTRKYPLPKDVKRLDQQIRHYHNIEKRSIGNLQRRAGSLRTIATTARAFLTRHKISPSLKDDIKDNIRGKIARPKSLEKFRQQVKLSQVDLDQIAKKKITEHELRQKKFNNLKDIAFISEYSAYQNKSFDLFLSKLCRRAVRKAQYIEKLQQHLINADRGFSGGRDDLIAYIRTKTYAPDDDSLVRMKPEVLMERIDPWHRDYEASFDLEANKYGFKASRGNSVYAAALYQWLNDNKHANTPFFVWLEGHYVCTGVADPRIPEGAYTESDGPVNYIRADKELSDKTRLVNAQNGSLWSFRIAQDGEVDVSLFDTQHVKGMMKTAQKEAYVWSRDGFIFTGEHIGGQFHHSSLVSGKKVKCAGMINVLGGKVKSVDNDSGHYKPESRHLRTFVEFLDRQNVFIADARIIDKSTKPETRANLKDFLAGDRTMRIRRDLQALQTKKKTLRDLVEKRFKAMKVDIGPAPEHALWIRAYKEVCLEFAELDQAWIRKANAPPIPRSKASRSR
jgi:hypothetical protein